MLKRKFRSKATLAAGVLSLVLVTTLAALAELKEKDPGPRTAPRGWTLVWSDEFNGPDGSLPDPKKWTYDIGVDGSGWGNNELEYYTNSPRNVSIHKGMLVITALKEKYTGPTTTQFRAGSAALQPGTDSGASTSAVLKAGSTSAAVPEGPSASQGTQPLSSQTRAANAVLRDYTSARIKTQRRFAQAYGRFEARIKVPRGQGMWPAFWMLGADIDRIDWPRCGEIDIMENVGKEPSKVHGSIHGPGPSGRGTDDMTATFTLPERGRFSDAFHVFAVEWEPRVIRFYVDNHPYETATPAGLPHGTGWVFDHPFFLLLNVAVGGSWPGSPDQSTHFPQQMLVDYVRVYARK